MLRGIHKASTTWLGKLVMGSIVGGLIIAFGIWGIGDVFRNFGKSTAIKIGRTEIGIEQFRTLYNDRLQQYSRQFGRPIGLEQARQLGLDRIAVTQIVTDFLLDERARKLGLNISDAEIIRRITTNPAFLGPSGQFDRPRFEALLRQNGFTEARFVAEERRQVLRRELGTTVAGGPNVPNLLMEAVNRYQNEQRAIEYVLVDQSHAGEIAAPTPEALQKYYDERKVLFRAPEYRKLVLVSLLPAEQAQWIEISDADARRAYEDRRARYVTPERRHIHQIVFPNMEEARAAADQLAAGKTFDDIAKERKLTDKDYDLGMIPKTAIIDRAVADAAFALKEGEVSAPVPGRFGVTLVQVVKIEPEIGRPFEQVAAEIKRELATERAKANILSIYDKMENERTDGKTLTEAANDLKVPVKTIDEVDRSGRDSSGALVTGIPDAQRLLTTAFATEVGADRDPLQVEGGYVWLDVAAVIPAHERPFDEVKDQVVARWHEQEIASRLKDKATEILDKLKEGAAFAEVAAANNLTVATATGIKRADAAAPLSAAAVDAIFRIAKGSAGSAEAVQGSEQIVFMVTEVTVPTLDAASEEGKRLRETLGRSVSEDLLSEYVAQLESEIGVTMNPDAIRQITTGRSGDDTN
jgi:peptidyl-prolyl cis-trans isomerase D